MKALRIGLGVLAGVLLASLALAQNPVSATLDVAVHDLQGKAISRATVTLQTPPGNPPPGGKFAARSTQTDDSGQVHFADLAPGRYRLTILAKGFDELSTNVDVTAPDADAAGLSANSIDAIVTTGGTHTDSITVQGVIDTPVEEANTPAVLERQQVKNLPDRPRTVTEALPLIPGVV